MSSQKTVARLSLYRRFLKILVSEEKYSVFSHELGKLSGVTAAQVRRDLMSVGYTGNPSHGYKVIDLLNCIDEFFKSTESANIILVGIGNIGRALLSYFTQGKSSINIIAAFDTDKTKINRVINGCHAYHINEMSNFINEYKVKTAVLAVPAIYAQSTAELLCELGIKGIMNFTPVRVKLNEDIYVEDMDITMHLEKVLYYSK